MLCVKQLLGPGCRLSGKIKMNAFYRSLLVSGLLSGLLTIAAFAAEVRDAGLNPVLFQKRPAGNSTPSTRTLIVSTEPAAIVWVDEIRRGSTDTTGKLSLK